MKNFWFVTLYEEEDYGSETSEVVGVFVDEEKANTYARSSIMTVCGDDYEYSLCDEGGHNRHTYHFFTDNVGGVNDSFKSTTYVVEQKTVASDID